MDNDLGPRGHAAQDVPAEMRKQGQKDGNLDQNPVQPLAPPQRAEGEPRPFKNPYLGDILRALYQEDEETTKLNDNVNNLKEVSLDKDRIIAALKVEIGAKKLGLEELKKDLDKSASEIQRLHINIGSIKECLGLLHETPRCTVTGCMSLH